ncbi:hypothetical protein GCM10011391_28390 [Pullulanibacillus camelliae]|uniref:Uncharacterized protein n=1 Tax=Pullulanibacillus camelliae TaxID=1707096 RepID=A0A8J2YJQ1_9BACL|nr:hypothetical protein [Pullulanibacillus camelliae]GGE47938.1 hypothetical protein GCM10011391_28390 [Pullulanibacillus camelliae]
MKPIEIPYSPQRFDQWRLSQVGGEIVFDKRGLPKFRFKTRQQLNQYMKLNKERGLQHA